MILARFRDRDLGFHRVLTGDDLHSMTAVLDASGWPESAFWALAMWRAADAAAIALDAGEAPTGGYSDRAGKSVQVTLTGAAVR
ncbi:MAG: hypothetical protein VW405_02590 [Rhodospirillaceae bacterium]